MDKPWYRSKTIWLNLALLVFTFLVDLPAQLRDLGVDEQTAMRVATIGNIGLRFLSVAKITFAATR